MANSNILIQLTLLLVLLTCRDIRAQLRPKDNGDIYIRQREQTSMIKTSGEETAAPIILQENNSSSINVEEIMQICNSSFSIPMDYIVQFNTTGELPDTTDKTGMCYIRCFFEKSGLIKNWKLNKDLIMTIMRPIMSNSIDSCEPEAKNEVNACVRTYAIFKCMMKRSFDNARNQTIV